MLALVLTLVFGLSTFHVHVDASLRHDMTLTAGINVDGVASEKAPDKDGQHDPSDCPICSLHTHILGSAPTEFAVALIALTERYALTSETGRLWPPSKLDRPPIDETK